MIFSALLYAALLICILGLIYKIATWFTRKVGNSASHITPSQRFVAAAGGTLGVVFSPKILTLLKVFILDILLQVKILREDRLRWVMHILIYWGFMLLLLMHALDKIVTDTFFSDYYSTANPFFFLRDFAGAMVIGGVGIAAVRRLIREVPRLKTNSMDAYAIIILALIMISGVVLEGLKMTAPSEFQAMVEDYGDPDNQEDVRALESLWVKEFGLVSATVEEPFDTEMLSQGREVHEDNCASCHSSNKWAFAGYTTAKILKPGALALDRAGGIDILWHLHFLACFIGLAYLPFSKMFHIIAAPVSILVDAVMDKEKSDPANILTKQALELDACTHCATCNRFCSAMMAYEIQGNEYILPSEKIFILKTVSRGKPISPNQFSAIQQGVYLCTNCDRCTVVCPSAINLKELWLNVREDLIQKGVVEPLILSPFSLLRGLNRKQMPADAYCAPVQVARQAVAGKFDALMDPGQPLFFRDKKDESWLQAPGDNTFAYCFGCQNCTTVCPVVQTYINPAERLGLLPHQIMCCLGLGLPEMAAGARMIWDCLTCYQCQEHCPQKVKVTDLLYELKNLAVRNIEKTAEHTIS